MQAYLMKNFDTVNEDDEGGGERRQMTFTKLEDSIEVQGGGDLRERASKLIAPDFIPQNLTDANLETALSVALSIERNEWCAAQAWRPRRCVCGCVHATFLTSLPGRLRASATDRIRWKHTLSPAHTRTPTPHHAHLPRGT